MLDTDQLRSFLAIVDTGSFTRAAERVNKTQSAVSMHVRRLEEKLDKSLFVKHGRGVKLTSDGEKLIDYARQILRLEASAFASVSEKGLAGRVRLGVPDDYTEAFLPEIMTRFLRRHPLVEVAVHCCESSNLAERMRRREIDIAIVTEGERVSGVEIIRRERLRWVSTARARIFEERPLPLALGEADCAWRRSAEAALEAAGISSRIVVASQSSAAISPIVRAGLAVTVMPESTIAGDLRVVGRDEGLPNLPDLQNVSFGVLLGADRSPETIALAEIIRETLSDRGEAAARGAVRTRRAPVAA